MFQATGKWISRLATDSRTVSTLCGLAGGTAWVSISAVWWSAYEPVWPARAAFAVAVIAALAIFSLSWVQAKLSQIPRFWRVGITSCGLASWPALWTLIAAQRGTFPIGWFTQDLPSFAATTLLAMGAIFPAVMLGCLPAIETHRRRSLPGGGTFWLGVAGAFAVAPTTLFARLPADRVLLLVAAAMLLGAGLSLVLKRDEIEAPAKEAPLTATEQSGWRLLLSLAACAGVAVAIEAALRTSEQLVIDSLPFKLLGWAGFLTGVSVSTWTRSRESRTELRRTLVGLGIASGAICWLFSTWVTQAIWTSGTLSSFSQIVIFKGLIPFAILAPVGWVCGRLCQGISPAISLCIMAAAWGVSSRGGWPLHFVLSGLSVSALLAGLALWPHDRWRELFRTRGRSWATVQFAAMAGLVVAAWYGQTALDLNRSSRLVFNAESFAAAANGHELATLEQSDRSRLVRAFDDAGDHWTLWRQRGCQLMVRRNGIGVAGMTSDTSMSPQNLWPILSTTVPLVFHPQVDHVLCVAPSGMAEVDALLSCPIQTLTCVSSTSVEQAVLREQARQSGMEHRFEDGRLEWKTIAPSNFAYSQDTARYDVIIVPEGVIAQAARQPLLTPEFHAAMAARLREDGIYCQRLSITDFGATPVIEMLRSLNTAFRQVSIVTTDGSELLLLGTNSEYPIVDDQLVPRLERPHIRKLCAQLGGDWSMLTQLAYVTPEKVAEITNSAAPGNRIVSGQFALRLASDALRWGEKWKEKKGLFSERATLVLVEMGLSEDAEHIIGRRIQDSQARMKILTETPDNQWVYRRELKDGLKNRPRTKIQKVNNEIRQTFDEYDQRRKAYLVALGAAARQPRPSLESIAAVEQFAEPYDPLLTDFAHFEAAHLLTRAVSQDAAREYRNWLHCIGYAPANDRSVRPVVAAMDLLRRHPEIVSDPQLRWEHHGALLDAMRLRWVNRWQQETKSKYEAADMQSAAVAISATLTAMDELAPTAGIDADAWKVQRQIWEDTLQSPLRERQGATPPEDQMLETVRQEWQRRNADLNETK